MEQFSFTLLLIILTSITSYLAFNNPVIKGLALFYPYAIFHRNEWYRFITGGFIHADWIHLIINMFVLYSFGILLEKELLPLFFGNNTGLVYVFLYLLGIIVSDIPSYLKQKNNATFSALGASGAVSAVVFASILINPWQGGIGLVFLPGITIPPVIFGGLYLLYSAYMGKKNSDHINHDAHFYGALFGLVFPGILKPQIFQLFIEQLQSKL